MTKKKKNPWAKKNPWGNINVRREKVGVDIIDGVACVDLPNGKMVLVDANMLERIDGWPLTEENIGRFVTGILFRHDLKITFRNGNHLDCRMENMEVVGV